MSFGFSVGDFIAALEVIGTVVNALRESEESGAQYRELVNQLYSLETALLHVKQLELEEEQRSEYISLRQSAAQCQRTVDDFWTKIQPYQKHLRAGGSSSKLKDGWMRVKWAMCQQEDLVRFKADLAAHTQSITIITTALQTKNLKNQDRKRIAEHKAISTTIQDATLRCMAKLVEMTATIEHGIVLGREIIQNTARIMATNIRIFQIVLSIQNIITRIPGQVERQQPVYMIDALGRHAPFYLEFIRSKEALQAVLKINFEKIPSGLRKINHGEYALLEAGSKRQIDLSTHWDACFMPGQRVEMRMIFQKQTRKLNSCPNCAFTSKKHTDEDVDCANCGLTFKRIVQIEEPPTDPQTEPKEKGVRDLRELSAALSYDSQVSESLGPPRPPTTAYDESEDIKYYRRVNVVQRQRRVVWGAQVDSNSKIDGPMQQTQGNKHEMVSEAVAENSSDASNIKGLEVLDDSVDTYIFDQILGVDDSDDEIEREFSRGLIFGGLETVEQSIRLMQNTLNGNSNDLQSIRGNAHWTKGACHTMGIFKVEDLALRIQDAANADSQSIEEAIYIITQLLGEMKYAFVDAHQKLRAFYREPQKEIEW